MKKLLIFALISLVIISCRKDDDEKSDSMIVGTWKIDKHITRYGNGSTVTDVLDDCQMKTNITFSKDGKVSSTGYFKTNDWSNICQTVDDNGTYVYNENNKTITLVLEKGETSTAEIENLTGKQLTLMVMEHDFDGDGTLDKLIRIFKK